MSVPDAGVYGTSVHGLLESDGFRSALLKLVGARRGRLRIPTNVCFETVRQTRFDRLADLLEQHADMDALLSLISNGRLSNDLPAEAHSS
jgi:adenosylcobyric acid synthase